MVLSRAKVAGKEHHFQKLHKRIHERDYPFPAGSSNNNIYLYHHPFTSPPSAY